jgi:hypothetical protein
MINDSEGRVEGLPMGLGSLQEVHWRDFNYTGELRPMQAKSGDDRRYIEEVWWLLHHSDDPTKETFALTCYLDESGIDNQGPVAAVGGLLLDKAQCLSFDKQWVKILNHYEINRPLHMKKFLKEQKRLSIRQRRGLFHGLSETINSYKAHSTAAVLSHEQFNKFVPDKIPTKLSLYGFCFILCAFQNHLQAESWEYKDRIAYLLEQPNEHSGDIADAHSAMIEWQKDKEFHMGTFGFADKGFSALEAADVIAWGTRRRISGKPFYEGFEHINDIFNPNHHVENTWDDKLFYDLTEWAAKQIAEPKEIEQEGDDT